MAGTNWLISLALCVVWWPTIRLLPSASVLIWQLRLWVYELRAFLRLAKDHDLRILIPMVTDLDDVLQVKAAMRSCAADCGIAAMPMLGAMIETPAAALFTREICREVDFVSIGTNDLTQYVMAAARGNPLVSRYYQEKHPAVMRMGWWSCLIACWGATRH